MLHYAALHYNIADCIRVAEEMLGPNRQASLEDTTLEGYHHRDMQGHSILQIGARFLTWTYILGSRIDTDASLNEQHGIGAASG